MLKFKENNTYICCMFHLCIQGHTCKRIREMCLGMFHDRTGDYCSLSLIFMRKKYIICLLTTYHNCTREVFQKYLNILVNKENFKIQRIAVYFKHA